MRSIFIGRDHIISYADTNSASPHKHWAKHITVSLEGQLKFAIGNNNVFCNGIVINSNVIHAVECYSQKHIVFMFEDTSDIAEEIERKYLFASDYCLLDNTAVCNIKRELELHPLPENNNEYYDSYYRLLGLLGLNSNIPCITDSRIVSILGLLDAKDEIESGIISEMIELTGISQSRLSHLFKEQAGVALNSYLVMVRLKKAYKYMIEGSNITNAALMAGFDSPSHFASTSRNLLGLSAQEISRECRFVIT